MKYIVALLFLSLLQVQCQKYANLDADIQKIMSDNQVLGITLSLLENGQQTYSQGYGLADYDRNISMTSKSIVKVASISKQVSVAALMILVDRGLVNLDEDINSYIGFPVRNPNFPDTPITLKMVASHTSSVHDGPTYSRFYLDTAHLNPPPHISGMLVPGGKQQNVNNYLNNRPGTQYKYCNFCFGLIGTVIERISGVRFDIFVRQNILGKLGIKNGFNVQDISSVDDVAVIYEGRNGTWQATADNFKGKLPAPRNISEYIIGTNGLLFSPQGGSRFTMPDLEKILQMYLGKGVYNGQRIISSWAVEQMLHVWWFFNGTNGDTINKLHMAQGLGIHVTTNQKNTDTIFPNQFMIGHTGSDIGLASAMYINKQTGTGFVFTINGILNGYDYCPESSYFKVEYLIYQAIWRNIVSKIVV